MHQAELANPEHGPVQPAGSPFTRGVTGAILAGYLLSGAILYGWVGPWEAVRHVLVNGLLVIGWLWSASVLLRGVPLPKPEANRHPRFELAWLLAGLAVAVTLAADTFSGWLGLPRWLFYAATYGSVLSLHFGLRYPLQALGLRWPHKRAWLVVLAAILINIGAAVIFNVIPEGEKAVPPQADLANQITGPLAALALMGGLLVRAALPEELLFRVGIQPRVAHFLPIGWAILIQALLFNTAHLPQQIFHYKEPVILAIGYLAAVDNGLLGGYLWYRTRSLPVLLLLHLFAYPRFGI